MHFDKLEVTNKEMTLKYTLANDKNTSLTASNTKYLNMFTEHEQ